MTDVGIDGLAGEVRSCWDQIGHPVTDGEADAIAQAIRRDGIADIYMRGLRARAQAARPARRGRSRK